VRGEHSQSDFLDPRKMLAELRGMAASSVRLGRDKLRGVATTRYRLVLEPEQAGPDDEGEARSAIEIWVDDDDVLRRFRAGEADGATVSEFYAFGEPLEIEPPPASEVREVDESELMEAESCPKRQTEPLQEDAVVAAFDRNGLVASVKPAGCNGGVLRSYTGERSEGAIPFDEGFVTCEIRGAPPAGAGDAVRRADSPWGDHALALANLECSLVVFDEKPARPEVRQRFERTFADLRRSLD
jgi:hypothetical protein